MFSNITVEDPVEKVMRIQKNEERGWYGLGEGGGV